MRKVVLSTNGVSSSSVYPVNVNATPFNIGLGLVVTGTVNCTVQHTFDDVFAPTFNPGTATWFSHATITGAASNVDGNYAFPVTGIRLLQNSGSGSAVLNVIQAGI